MSGKEHTYRLNDWLPTTKKEVEKRGWTELDVILFSGDAYIDHPSFGPAVIGRLLESIGLKVAIVPQPNWQDDLRDFKKLGKPRLFFGVTAGSMDSMVNHYTANKRLRSNDAYTPGGKAGFRPDYTTICYSKILKDIFPEVPVVIGGVEASLRRLTHYDYWSDELKPSILAESNADLLIYGMGEKPLSELVKAMEQNIPFSSIHSIPQTSYKTNQDLKIEIKNWEDFELYSHEECFKDKIKYAKNFKIIEEESNKYQSNKRLIQKFNKDCIVINPPFEPISSNELDSVYNLPFTRLPHPKYAKKEPIPAYEMIRHSITMHRGCFGACSFCTISAHQGKFISSRSERSILKEVDQVVNMHDFKGYISDLGGPSANMYKMQGLDLEMCKACKRASCLHPNVCKNLNTSPKPLTKIYKEVNNNKDIKKAFVGSGIRYDLFMHKLNDPDYLDYADELIKNHISGRLKIAPEHTSNDVLKIMRKPNFKMFHDFKKIYDQINKKYQLNQQLIPYFISSHPGCKNIDMAELAVETKDLNFKLEQIQDFTPTPMTLATVMYYSGINPYTMEKVTVAKNKNEKLSQRKFFFWYKSEFRNEIISELRKANRDDIIENLFGKISNSKSSKGKKRRK
ncbi:MAG: YgiQ family radical SAM protein [Bacteroidales bacterium]|nr:YgiQ family radical SAM protein [Bacteroidales bacterium]